MNVSEFCKKLWHISNSYHWNLNDNKLVAIIQSGPHRGYTLNPITALAHKQGRGFFDNTRDGTEEAARYLGLSRNFARNVYSATLATSNHGNTQVLRGRIRSALEV